MRRFFFFGSSPAKEGSGNGTPGDDTKSKNRKTLEEGDDNASSASSSNRQVTRMSRSRSRRAKPNNEEPTSNPKQLRRCMSFSSAATNNFLKEHSFSFSGERLGSFCNESDAPHHAGDVNPYGLSPERLPNTKDFPIKVPMAHSVWETDSPRSRCYSCSTGHSPPGSPPVVLRCRSTRLSNLLNKDEVLDGYIDGGQETATQNETRKQNSPTRSVVSNSGKPPRPQYAVPSFQKSTKESIETYQNLDLKDAYLHQQLAQQDRRDTCKIITLRNASKNHEGVLEDLGTFPHSEDYKSESIPSFEDIYEDFQDKQSSSVSCDAPQYFHDNDLDFAPEGHDTDDKLLQRVNEVEAKFVAPSADNYSMSRYKLLSSDDMFQLIQSLTEDRRQLARELSSHIQARLAERFSFKEQHNQSMKELDIRTRRLEKEKAEVQATLEREMDRRSNDWSDRLLRFQYEEGRLRERVRELAEQNVSFQRELTSLEANRVDASDKVASLEMQNIKLNDELKKVRSEHDTVHNSSVQLHAQFKKAAEENDHIRGFLKSKEADNKALHKVIASLQTVCSEQEKTITGLRQGFGAELDKESSEFGSERRNRIQMELIRLTGVEQKLRAEVQSHHLEVQSLRQENVALLNRLQSTENGSSFSSILLDQELKARVDNLQIQGLSLLDKSSELCVKSLDSMKCKRQDDCDSDIDALDCTLELQSIKGGIESMKRSLRATHAVLTDKQKLKDKSGDTAFSGSSPREQKDGFYMDNSKLSLKEEVLLNRLLKEALLSKELYIEQLQSDVSSLLRIQHIMRNEVQRLHDELSCITHKAKHLQLQGLKKDESISQTQQDIEVSSKELSSLRGTLKIVTDERDHSWQEAKQLRKTVSIMQNEISSLKKKIECLEEDVLVKEGQVSILQDNVYKPRQLDFICSPGSMKQFGME